MLSDRINRIGYRIGSDNRRIGYKNFIRFKNRIGSDKALSDPISEDISNGYRSDIGYPKKMGIRQKFYIQHSIFCLTITPYRENFIHEFLVCSLSIRTSLNYMSIFFPIFISYSHFWRHVQFIFFNFIVKNGHNCKLSRVLKAYSKEMAISSRSGNKSVNISPSLFRKCWKFEVNPLMRFKFCVSFNPCTGLSQVVPEVFVLMWQYCNTCSNTFSWAQLMKGKIEVERELVITLCVC